MQHLVGDRELEGLGRQLHGLIVVGRDSCAKESEDDFVARTTWNSGVQRGGGILQVPGGEVGPGGADARPERIVDLQRPSSRAGDVACGDSQPCSNSGQPLLATGSEGLGLDQRLGLFEDATGGVELAVVDVGLGELQHGDDPAVEHRLRRRRRQLLELGEGSRSVAELAMRDGLSERQLGSKDHQVGDGRGVPNPRRHSKRVDGPPGQRVAQRPRSLQRQAAFGITAQGEIGVAHVVARLGPPFRQGDPAGDHVPDEATERVAPPGLTHLLQRPPSQRLALGPVPGEGRHTRLQHRQPVSLGSRPPSNGRPTMPPVRPP